MKRAKYLDPKDEYVRSEDPVTIAELAGRWHREHGDGYSESWLRKRSARESWQKERLAHWERARHITATKELEKTADEHARVIGRYTALLDGIMGGAVRFLRKFEPPPGATDAERATFVPDYKNAREAAVTLMAAIALDRDVRGYNVQKVQDVTDDEDSTDVYADLSDDELERIANGEDTETDAGGCEA